MNLHLGIYLFNYINDQLLVKFTYIVLVFPLLTFKIKYRLGDY